VERLACIIGLIGVGLHELVDFGLELGGLAVPATAALAVATTSRERAFSLPKKVVAAIVPAAVLITVFAFSHSLLSLEEEGKKLAQQFGNKKAASFEQEAKDIMARHPADYYLQLLVAQAFAEETPLRTDKLVEYANRAMFLKPMLAQPHRLAAMALRHKGWLTQAKIEYRLAFQSGDLTVLPEITQVFASPGDMEEAVAPPGIPSPELKEDTQTALLSLASELIKQKRAEESEAVAHSALKRCGESLPTLQVLARIASMRTQPEELHRLGKRMSIVSPESPEGLHTRVRAAIMNGDLSGGLELLEKEGLAKFSHERSVLVTLASLRLRNKDTKGGREILHRLITTNTSQRLEVLSLEASAAEIDGQLARAVAFLRTGVQLQPHNAGWRWRHAAMLERVGKLEQAQREAEKAAEIAPAYVEALTKLKARIAEKKQQTLERKLWNEVSSGDSLPAN
jgi:tetratricopeptide (TPR) repeat protein